MIHTTISRVAVSAALLFGATNAAAQVTVGSPDVGSSRHSIWGYRTGLGDSEELCAPPNQTGPVETTCGGFFSGATLRNSAPGGALRSQQVLTAENIGRGELTTVQEHRVTGQVVIDLTNLAGISFVTGEFDFYLHGTLMAQTVTLGESSASAFARVFYDAAIRSADDVTPYQWHNPFMAWRDQWYVDGGAAGAGIVREEEVVNRHEMAYLDLVIGQVNTFEVEYSLTTWGGVAGFGDNEHFWRSQVAVHFQNTAGIFDAILRGYDADGNSFLLDDSLITFSEGMGLIPDDLTPESDLEFPQIGDPGPPTPTATPEPVTMTLLGTGLAGVAAARRRRRNRAP